MLPAVLNVATTPVGSRKGCILKIPEKPMAPPAPAKTIRRTAVISAHRRGFRPNLETRLLPRTCKREFPITMCLLQTPTNAIPQTAWLRLHTRSRDFDISACHGLARRVLCVLDCVQRTWFVSDQVEI